MTRANYCEFFRFDDQFCDVFIEDNHYLYVEATPYNWPYLLQCNEYHTARNLHGITEFVRYDASGADTEYLQGLEYAPADIAADIIRREYARALFYATRGESCYWYGFDEPPTMGECIEDANECAGNSI